MRKGLLHGCLAVAAGLLLATTSNANIIVNGSFEDGTGAPGFPPGYVTLTAGDSSITGWTVLPANIDWKAASYWQASHGNFSLDLSGFAPGGISQVVSTVPGGAYLLTYDISVNPDPRHSDVARQMDINIVDFGTNTTIVLENQFASRGTRTFTNMQWETRSLNFIATGTLTTIEFSSNPLNIDAGGPALDNVILEGGVVTPVPAPAGVILAGLGSLGLWIGRRRMMANAV